MARNRFVRKKRGSSWTSESSRRANKARWDADRARRGQFITARRGQFLARRWKTTADRPCTAPGALLRIRIAPNDPTTPEQ